MTHSNGKHRIASLAGSSTGSTNRPAAPASSIASGAESWGDRIEAAITESHKQLMAKSSEFIRQRPGTSLLIAVAVGGIVGWLIKRRG